MPGIELKNRYLYVRWENEKQDIQSGKQDIQSGKQDIDPINDPINPKNLNDRERKTDNGI